MPPRKDTQKRKEAIGHLPDGSLQTTFALESEYHLFYSVFYLPTQSPLDPPGI
jgi:hypothetical protein